MPNLQRAAIAACLLAAAFVGVPPESYSQELVFLSTQLRPIEEARRRAFGLRCAHEGRDRRRQAHHGLREYYDPRDGKGLGGKEFSWSAAIWLSWLSPARDADRRRDLITAP